MSALRNIARKFKQALLRRAEMRAYMREVAHFKGYLVRHEYCGFHLNVNISDSEGETWYDRDWPMPLEIEVLTRNQLRHGAKCLNIGSHQGVLAMVLARLVGEYGRVLAVDPSPHNTSVMQANLDANGISNVAVLQAAISASNSPVSFGFRANDRVDPNGPLVCRGITIDTLTQEFGTPDIVTVDVEGFELEALRGASKLLADGSNDWCIEVHAGMGLEDFGGSVAAVAESFSADRFDLLVVLSDGLMLAYRDAFGKLNSRFHLLAIRKS
jgi:FkbM family methyltransferase